MIKTNSEELNMERESRIAGLAEQVNKLNIAQVIGTARTKTFDEEARNFAYEMLGKVSCLSAADKKRLMKERHIPEEDLGDYMTMPYEKVDIAHQVCTEAVTRQASKRGIPRFPRETSSRYVWGESSPFCQSRRGL